jgi:hypothetical protein
MGNRYSLFARGVSDEEKKKSIVAPIPDRTFGRSRFHRRQRRRRTFWSNLFSNFRRRQ